MKSYEDKLQENANLAVDQVNGILRGGEFDQTKAKIASASISQFHRYLATKTNSRAIDFAIAKTMAADREELKKMIGSSQVKLIDDGAAKADLPES